jgi:3-oxoacyl-[acyl-carrier protein] reductase
VIDPGLQGKVVLVTGANHGIGAATAKAFARIGASVLINYLRLPALGTPSQSLAQEREAAPGLALYNFRRSLSAGRVVEEIRAQGGAVEALEADLSSPETIPLLFERAEALFGPVDVLVNNADYGQADTFLPQSSQEQITAPAGYAVASLSAASHDAHFAVNSRAVALMMGPQGSSMRCPMERVNLRWNPTVGQRPANSDRMGLQSIWSLQGQSKQDISLQNWSRD